MQIRRVLGVLAVATAAALPGIAAAQTPDTTAPTLTSIVRQNPTAATTAATTVTFRLTFNEAVMNVDKTDFTLAGTAATGSAVTTVTQITQSVYDLAATTADGTLYVVVRTANDNIEDLAGNDYNDLVGSYETYTVAQLPTIAIDADTKTDTQPVTDTEVVVTDDTAISTSGVTVHSSTTVGVSAFSCAQTTSKKVTCTMTISGTGQLVIAASDAAGNATTATASGYAVSTDIDIDTPDISFTDKIKGLGLSKKKQIYITKTSVTFKGDADALKGGTVKIYDGKDKLGETTISTTTGEWRKAQSFKNGGTYELKFKFYDKHDKLIDTKGTYELTVDSEAPKFDTMPATLTKRAGAKVWWSATDNDKVSRYRYEWLGKKVKTTTPSFVVPAGSPLGPQTLTIRAYDRAGNRAEKTVKVNVVK